MPLYHVTFIRELEAIIEADDPEELERACDKHCMFNDIDDWYPGDWEFYATRTDKGEPSMRVLDGDCVAIEDYNESKKA